MHLVMVSADARLGDVRSEVFARHAAYAAALVARCPGAVLSVVVPGLGSDQAHGALRLCARLPRDPAEAVTAQAPWSASAWRLATRLSVPFLAQLHFDPFAPATAADRARALLARLAVEKSARIRVMAPATAQALAARWGIDPARIWLAPVPIAWPVLGDLPRERLVVGAMRLAPDRAPLGWIAVARRIAALAPGVRFVLAGEGRLLGAMREAAAGLPIDLPGQLDGAALSALLSRGALFLHTAPHEAFGRAMPALAAATRVWRDFAPNPEEVYKLGYKNMKQGWAKA